jgi:hypothetical protein
MFLIIKQRKNIQNVDLELQCCFCATQGGYKFIIMS